MEDFSWLRGRTAELVAAVANGDRRRAEQLVAHTSAEGGVEAAGRLLTELLVQIQLQATTATPTR
ncbi:MULTISPECIES: hypothetical protein [unclassified Crossiella]|uniref:hypothetical protein n=1 Tax=unclassified Crossiella TaxID=2620835 RepID=UPI0020005A05|nr:MULTISPECIES: hypothetical protein [unclassified Crossiella]MCK2244202.1 hypothetical protein [Crossiella sp. S99.2]MCK2258006.1 hypothetical protein [Crossiella sp. S99.1]